MMAAYGDDLRRWWHPVPDSGIVLIAGATTVGVWLGPGAWLAVVVVASTALIVTRGAPPVGARVDLAVVLAVAVAVAAGLGAVASERAWRAVVPDRVGPFQGWTTVMTDPRPLAGATVVVLEVEGERFEAVVHGRARRRLTPLRVGERVEVSATRVPLRPDTARRVQARHVVGRLRVDAVGATAPGTPLSTGINRLRGRLAGTAEHTMAVETAALFTGLVIGDDTRQDPGTVSAFRAAGLSHLTAVSGQNVALVIASAGFFLRRLPAWWRLGATWALIAWFVLLTRAEPSVVRAGAMAACTSWAFALGRDRTPLRVLGLAVTALVLVDPLLVWSVGFWLSVTATLGVTVVAPWLASHLAGPEWLVAPLSVTLGAQAGVALPSWLVFGRFPVLGVPANLLAVPVAGAVMFCGLPVALVASLMPAGLADLLMAPVELGTRWVATVAVLAARLEPMGVSALMVWAFQLVVLAVLIGATRAR